MLGAIFPRLIFERCPWVPFQAGSSNLSQSFFCCPVTSQSTDFPNSPLIANHTAAPVRLIVVRCRMPSADRATISLLPS
jgi:hypothetical protein